MRIAGEGGSHDVCDHDRETRRRGSGIMASQRQINANRRNSTRSTGPVSTEGRAASARNAIIHGLTAEKFGHLEDVAIIDTRMKEWNHELKCDGPYQQCYGRLAVA